MNKYFSWFHSPDPEHNNHENIFEYRLNFKNSSYRPYTRLHHSQSAIRRISLHQKLFFSLLIIVFIVLAILNLKAALISGLTILTFLYFCDLLFKLYLVLLSLRNTPEIQVTDKELAALKTFPTYSIICPLYHEPEMAKHFVKAMQKLDYPTSKLQILLTLEEDDKHTIKEIKKLSLPSHFKILVVPHDEPKTKPKACNYALHHATGEYIVIYDAEDEPEKDQLKKAVIAFKKLGDEKVICLQAKLNYYNPHQNILTRLFTLEYSQWFDLILPGLHQLDVPIPLGGTSNHFKKDALKLLHGWDPFNVTEDCDLGVRLYKKGYETKVLDSCTWEEANSSLSGWLRQRSRWIKGYIQTYFVHTRNLKEFKSDFASFHILAFHLIVGGTPLSMLVNPILWVLTIAYFVFRSTLGDAISSLFPTEIYYFALFCLVFGNFLYVLYYMLGVAKREDWGMVKWFFFVPLYWLFMSVGAWIALFELVADPFRWKKTKHGLHLNGDSNHFLF